MVLWFNDNNCIMLQNMAAKRSIRHANVCKNHVLEASSSTSSTHLPRDNAWCICHRGRWKMWKMQYKVKKRQGKPCRFFLYKYGIKRSCRNSTSLEVRPDCRADLLRPRIVKTEFSGNKISLPSHWLTMSATEADLSLAQEDIINTNTNIIVDLIEIIINVNTMRLFILMMLLLWQNRQYFPWLRHILQNLYRLHRMSAVLG